MRAPLVLLLVLTLAGCSVRRPGEIAPRDIPGCAELVDQARASAPALLTPEQLDRLNYCHTAAAAESARATESHTNFTADLGYISLVLSLVLSAITIAVNAD